MLSTGSSYSRMLHSTEWHTQIALIRKSIDIEREQSIERNGEVDEGRREEERIAFIKDA